MLGRLLARTFRLQRWLRGLRTRLTFSYILFFAAALSLLGLIAREGLEAILYAQAKALLVEEWGVVNGYLRIERLRVNPYTGRGNTSRDEERVIWFYDTLDPEESAIVERVRRIVFVANAQGHRLYLSDDRYLPVLGERPETIAALMRNEEPSYTLRKDADGRPYLVRSAVYTDRKFKYFVAIGRSLSENRSTLQQFTWYYFITLPFLMAISSLLGWVVAGRVVQPVNALAETAQRITSSNLNTQIPLRGANDELDRLIEAFNRMVERLSASFTQIRQFSTDVSHELRTPLTSIRGELEVALFTAETVEQYRNAMQDALQDVERLSSIVRALLLLSQAESGQLALQRSRLDLAEVVREVVDQFQILAESASVTLQHELPAHCWVSADRVQMERLLHNLLSNALKYTPDGGSVQVRLHGGDRTAVLEVQDTGVGIPAESIPHIFDRFYRVPSADPEKGLGLGLSFVAWIVKAHGGKIEVESQISKGTRFTVTFPAAQAPVETASALQTENS